MPHCEIGEFHVRHPDFYVIPIQPQEDSPTRTINIVCGVLALALTPVIAIVLIALYIAWNG